MSAKALVEMAVGSVAIETTSPEAAILQQRYDAFHDTIPKRELTSRLNMYHTFLNAVRRVLPERASVSLRSAHPCSTERAAVHV